MNSAPTILSDICKNLYSNSNLSATASWLNVMYGATDLKRWGCSVNREDRYETRNAENLGTRFSMGTYLLFIVCKLVRIFSTSKSFRCFNFEHNMVDKCKYEHKRTCVANRFTQLAKLVVYLL